MVPVLLFHADFETFSGGFIGVDIFFVISGYLIASFILAALDAGRFSILAFYERRIRRIFPALFATIAVSVVIGTFLFLPNDLNDLGQSAIAATLFASNVLFWHEAGYFDVPAEQKPLLHTWTLAVEEQFYLVFPVFLLLLYRTSRCYIRYTVPVLLLSFALAVWSVPNAPSAGFYLAPMRAWELLLGSLLAMGAIPALGCQHVRNGLSLLGLGLIAWSILAFSPETPFPGQAALLPCLGAGLVIYSDADRRSVAGRILSARPIVFTGLISYSLYLWHWPVLVFAQIYALRELTGGETLAVLALTVLIAIASWRYIERPFRVRQPLLARPQLFAAAGIVMCLTVALGLGLELTQGLQFRLPPEAARLAAGAKDRESSACLGPSLEAVRAGRLCQLGLGEQARPTFVLWGDSHAGIFQTVIATVAMKAGRTGLFAGYPNCPPLVDVTVSSPDSTAPQGCRAFNEAVLDLVLRSDIDTVILGARWSMYATGVRFPGQWRRQVYLSKDDTGLRSTEMNEAVFRRGIEETVAALVEAGKQVIVVAPIPEVGSLVPSTLALAAWRGWDVDIRPAREDFDARHRIVMSALAELSRRSLAKIIYPHVALCDESKCRVESAGRALYRDDNHLSVYGASSIRHVFDEALWKDRNAEEETQARGDRRQAAPGGRPSLTGAERGRGDPLDRHDRGDPLDRHDRGTAGARSSAGSTLIRSSG